MRFWCVKYGGVAIKQGVCVCCFYRLCKLMHTEKPVFLGSKKCKFVETLLFRCLFRFLCSCQFKIYRNILSLLVLRLKGARQKAGSCQLVRDVSANST